MQEMSMDYHFKVEQESGSSTCAFFGFNGKAYLFNMHILILEESETSYGEINAILGCT